MILEMIEWTALALGTIGSILWSLGRSQFIVALLWMGSSLLWIGFAISNGHAGLTLRDVFGFGFALVGVRTHWQNLRAGRPKPVATELC